MPVARVTPMEIGTSMLVRRDFKALQADRKNGFAA